MTDLPDLTRRSFMTKTSLGVAAAGALVAAGPLTSSITSGSARVHELPEPVVAHLTDLRSGTVMLYVGERGVKVVDHTLAQHLARAVAD